MYLSKDGRGGFMPENNQPNNEPDKSDPEDYLKDTWQAWEKWNQEKEDQEKNDESEPKEGSK